MLPRCIRVVPAGSAGRGVQGCPGQCSSGLVQIQQQARLLDTPCRPACRLAKPHSLTCVVRGLQVMLVDNPKAAKEAYAQIVKSKRIAMAVEGPDRPGGEGRIRLVQVCTHDAAANAALWRFQAALFASHICLFYEQPCGQTSAGSQKKGSTSPMWALRFTASYILLSCASCQVLQCAPRRPSCIAHLHPEEEACSND